MFISKITQSVLLASVLAATSLAANATIVDYQGILKSNNQVYLSGSFAGTDINNDGVLTLNELTSFDLEAPSEGIVGLGLSSLVGFGTYDIATNFWSHDASGWGQANFSWASWNGGNSALNTQNFTVNTTVVSSDVPEPLTLALFGIGLLGLAAARHRKE
ncbi:PEP-CTERM sorting domain-containing protein [Undibacterium terreum]|uniref:Ice-binding protein C-terminal domain-containing protein n=1 Tax=Undibacterium terreum TaxID=1224302 RepID=A0A916UW05_9BURK|nr:PEP-CTERM sorting domain-containing protein [Undibacterium terreum]GGC87788.1 hypothetical protein GCM10011396_38770 [Undibacterium terreum]